MESAKAWYSVKCIFLHNHLAAPDGKSVYEERIVLFAANSLDEALQLAETEAESYARANGDIQYCQFASAYQLPDGEIMAGAEVYSLMRRSPLEPKEFIDKYYDDGTESVQRT